MFYNWCRIWWSRNQLWNCTHFRHPTDEQLRQLDIYRNRTSDRGLPLRIAVSTSLAGFSISFVLLLNLLSSVPKLLIDFSKSETCSKMFSRVLYLLSTLVSVWQIVSSCKVILSDMFGCFLLVVFVNYLAWAIASFFSFGWANVAVWTETATCFCFSPATLGHKPNIWT